MRILVTGAAGFIGFHLSRRLAVEGHEVTGYDNINDYYDVNLKLARLSENGIDTSSLRDGEGIVSGSYPAYRFIKGDLANRELIEKTFSEGRFDRVVNLAAQAGVRYSLVNPGAYIDSNITGFANILEACRKHNTGHLVYASSSSVYGLNEQMPFSTDHNVDHPISLYAASKKSNELMAHTYSHLFGLPTTGLRFFTVYGPWGRPDMALYIFTRAIMEGRPIEINNNGEMSRDFTYIDDIVEAVTRVIGHIPSGDPSWSGKNPSPATSPAPYRVFNIGNSSPVKLMDFIRAIEKELGREAIKRFQPMQPGDVSATWADVEDLFRVIDFRPATGIEEGIGRFVKWYKDNQ